MGVAKMSSEEMEKWDHGIAAILKRLIMDRDTYVSAWGKGAIGMEKKRMIQAGTLDQRGKPNDKTPKDWLRKYLERTLSQ